MSAAAGDAKTREREAKPHYTKLTNVGYVDGPGGVRHWAYIILIDAPKEPTGRSFDDVRQIRGLGKGGLPVFTYWIALDCDVQIEGHAGGRVCLLRDGGELKPMDAGVVIKAGELTLMAGQDDLDAGVQVSECDDVPFGDEADRDILEHYRAPYYSRPQCVSADALRAALSQASEP